MIPLAQHRPWLRRGLTAVALLLVLATPGRPGLAQDTAPAAMLVPHPAYGTVLADPSGWTLYVRVDGTDQCADPCADWIPYVVDRDPVAPQGLSASLGLVEREDGSWQLTIDGLPLYSFAGDAGPGEVNGNGLQGFAVVAWSVPSLSEPGALPEAPPAALIPAPPVSEPVLPSVPGPSIVPPPAIPSAPSQPAAPPASPAEGGALPLPPPPPAAAIPASSTIAVLAPPSGSVVLTWMPTPSAQSYRVYQTTAAQPLNLSVVQTVSQTTPTGTSSTTVSGLTPGQQYLFQVRAVDPFGQEMPVPVSAQVVPTFGSTPLSAPSGLTVANASGTSVTLTWAPVPGAASYRVLQSSGPAGPFVPALVGPITGTTATISGLTPGAPYVFQVIAVDSQGNQSPPSNPVATSSGSTLAAPTNVAVPSVTATTVTLTWSPVPGAVSYRVRGSRSLTGPFLGLPPATVIFSGLSTGSAVGNAGAARPSATITNLTPGTSYYFQVFAVDSLGHESAPSNVVNALTAAQ